MLAHTHTHAVALNFAQITGAIIPIPWNNHGLVVSVCVRACMHRTIEWEFIQLIVNVTLNYYCNSRVSE